MTDLFETPEMLPIEVQNLLNSFADSEQSYKACEELEVALKSLGYTFEWGLDASPYNLRKIN